MAERRRYERRAIEFEATLSFAGESVQHRGVCRDLSEGGLFLATSARPEVSTEGRLMTTMPGSSELLTLPVVVRWHGRDGLGLQFGELRDHEVKAVNRALLRALPKRSFPPARRRSPLWLRAVGLVAALATAATAGFFGARYSQRIQRMIGWATGSAERTPPALSSAERAKPEASGHATASSSAVPRPPAPAPSPSASSAAPASAAAPAVSSASAAASSVATPPISPPDGSDPSACIAAFFPEKAFRRDERLDFVCSEADPRKAASQMRIKIVIGSSGQATPAVNEWSRLGWYELAVLAITRRACCAGTAPVQLPESPAECQSFAGTLNALGEAMATRKDPAEAVKAFETSAECIQRSGKGGYRYTSGPFSGSQVAFASFMKRNEQRTRGD